MPHLAKYKTTTQTGSCRACHQPQAQHCCSEYYRARTIEPIGYERWLDNVRIAVSEDIDDDILYDYIRRGCIEFAKKTTLLRRNIELKLQNCVGDYYPCLGEQERISSVLMLSIGGHCYQAIGDICAWDVEGYKYWFYPPHTLEIHPVPKKCDNQSVILSVIALPTEDSKSVDKILFDSYFEAIEHYAIAKALMLPLARQEKQENIYPDSISFRLAQFYQAINRAKIQIARHYSQGGQRYGRR